MSRIPMLRVQVDPFKKVLLTMVMTLDVRHMAIVLRLDVLCGMNEGIN